MNGGAGDRMMMGHDGPSHPNNRHYDSHVNSMPSLNAPSSGAGGSNTPVSHANNLIQKEQVIIKQVSSEKADKRNKKERGPTKDEYMVRVATFVNDVMFENIKQQIDEEIEQKKATAEETSSASSAAAVPPPVNDAKDDTAVQEVVVEVVDAKEEVSTATVTPEKTVDIQSVKEVEKSLDVASDSAAPIIETGGEQTAAEQSDLEAKEKKLVEANDEQAADGDSKGDEKVDVGAETKKEDDDAVVADKQQEHAGEDGSKPAEAEGEVLDDGQQTTTTSVEAPPTAVPEEEDVVVVEVQESPKPPSLMEELVNAFSELKIPEKFMRDAIIKILNEVLDRPDTFHAKTIEFLQVLRTEAKLSNSAALESFKSVVNGMSEKEKTIPKITTIMASLLSRAVALNLCKLTDVSSYTDNGQHYPLFLLVLQHLHKQLGKPALQEMFSKSKVNLMASLPECDRTKERMAEILEDRSLSFLYPLLRVQAELWKQILSDANPQQFYKWIKENVEPTCYTDPGFVTAVMTVLLKYIGQESDKLEDDKKRIEKEKEILTKYCLVLNAFLNSNIDLQLIAIYAIQVHWYGIGYPKGVLLRWFQEMYELNVIEEDAFLRYKEDVTDIYPGKGKALFQVNQWLTWLAEAEDEDDDEED